MEITDIIVAGYTAGKQAELRTTLGMEVMRKALEARKASLEWTVRAMESPPPRPSPADGKGMGVDVHA